jgi:hypothetical protein
MPSIRTALVAAALTVFAHPGARAQATTPPHKRLDVVREGMTPAQVRALLGEPLRVSRDGGLTYLYFANGCAGCSDDYVVVRDCRVVGARFENPNRYVARADSVDPVAPPAAECALAAAEPAPAPASAPAAAPPPDTPPPAPPAAPREAVPADAPARAMPQEDPAGWRRNLALRHPASHLVAVPAASISSPTAFGAEMGQGFVGFAYQARTRFTHLSDGAAVVAAGIGDRQRAVALELALTTYSTLHGGPFETGGVSFKLHRAVGEHTGVAVGVENALDWGGSDAGRSPYAVATHVVELRPDAAQPFSAVTATLGVGAGRFRSENDVAADHATVNVFGALGVQVIEPVSVSADWNGQDLFTGVSVSPSRHLPLVLNAGLADVTGTAGDGVRFIFSAGLGFRWLPPFF